MPCTSVAPITHRGGTALIVFDAIVALTILAAPLTVQLACGALNEVNRLRILS
jgi:hypothetical protein